MKTGMVEIFGFYVAVMSKNVTRGLCCWVPALLMIVAMPSHAQDWAKYQSQNFTVYTDRRESQVQTLIEELEIFPGYCDAAAGFVAGFYTNTNDGPKMVMGSDRQDAQRAKEMLFHEYIHHLTFEHSPNFTYPRWYIEGLAELLGSTKVERNSVVVGGRPALANALDYYGVLRLADVLQNRRLGERAETLTQLLERIDSGNVDPALLEQI